MEVVSRPGSPTWATVVAGQSGAATALSALLAAQAGKRMYLDGFAVTGAGATAASVITVSITGIDVQLDFKVAVPAGAAVGIEPLVVPFTVPVAASADGTGILVSVPSLGAGNLHAAVAAWGHVL